ncbi:helix-turn-helix transcriptional regulator [Kitasatospora cheerisanensis]|uniref:HTH luxR-type domain-containing protein n=1 Tax=Kitasatospora cheerisanensis KCTC 2395 TaxID=1348663 RepID=A0A066YZY5_9ACTN|nr:helix-turn-helix transcriptional regulator [Kitasatospora cheerisanensis]KDN83495.1 hypothetical protein KCH_49770 [Kitasatospora cheerisanensis KCTC 2395]
MTCIQPGPALDSLIALRLAAPDPLRPGHYTALDATAAALQMQLHLQNLGGRYLAQAAAVVGEMGDLIGAYQLARPAAGAGAIEYITGLDVIQDRLTPLLEGCRESLFTAQPNGARPAAQLALSYQRDLAVLQRGVQMRTVYHCSVRQHEPTARWAATVSVHGAEVRTVTSRGYPRTVIIDSRVAITTVLTPWEGDGPEPDRALLITDEGVVRALSSVFGLLWDAAQPWDGTLLVEVTPTQKAILAGLAAGHGAEQIGRVLGVTRRTVTNHLEPIRQALNIESIPQLTYWWGRNEDNYQHVTAAG